jgi:PPOX class probable F420-dependent enzyme
LWDGQSFLIYSRENAPKLKNIARNPRVALSLNSDPLGTDVAIITGDAQVDESAPPCTAIPDYVAKYSAGIQRIGLTPEHFALAYSVAVRVTPTKLRGF